MMKYIYRYGVVSNYMDRNYIWRYYGGYIPAV